MDQVPALYKGYTTNTRLVLQFNGILREEAKVHNLQIIDAYSVTAAHIWATDAIHFGQPVRTVLAQLVLQAAFGFCDVTT